MEYPLVLKITKSNTRVHLVLKIVPELEAFNGHFENALIVPGVVQIQWAVKYAQLHFQELPQVQVEALEVLKFQKVIQPNSEVELEIKLINNKLVFVFLSGDIKHSSGKIVIS